MSIDEQPMNVYWSGKRTETSNNFKTNYKGSVATKNNLPSSGNKTGDMYNVTESGENFIWNGSSWDSLSGDTLKILNWQKSEKASAVVVYPVPDTVLEPVVSFLCSETAPAEGDKSLSNPSTITPVDSIEVYHGKASNDADLETIKVEFDEAYGGSVNLLTGVLSEEYIKVSFNGSEPWGDDGTVGSYSRFFTATAAGIFPVPNSAKTGKCTHCDYVNGYSTQSLHTYVRTSGRVMVFFPTEDFADAAAVKAFMLAQYKAGTPFTVIYPVSSPAEKSVEQKQVYSLKQADKYIPQANYIATDAAAVQVGYAKSPIRTEYELTQAIVAIEGGE